MVAFNLYKKVSYEIYAVRGVDTQKKEASGNKPPNERCGTES